MNNEMTTTDRKSRIRRGLPIEESGLIFYPIRMADYEEFLDCKCALAIRLTSLAETNIEYLSMPFISALWAVDLDMLATTGKTIGVFERVIRLLYLSLRLEYDSQKVFSHIFCETNNPRKLSYIEVMNNDDKLIKISPLDFSLKIRQLIADQNGIVLPDESLTIDLVKEEESIIQDKKIPLKIDINSLISSVAYSSRLRDKDMDEWTVKEFEQRRSSIERDKYFTLYSQAEMSGMVKFDKGNPYPSWCFDKDIGLSPALKTTSEVKGNFAALGDIEQAIKGQ